MRPADPDLAELNAGERLSLVQLFSELDAEQLDTPSLCRGWSVGDVLAHLATPYLRSPAEVVLSAVRCRGFGGAMAEMASKVGREPLERQLEAVRRSAEDPFVPPMLGLGAPLTDAIVHGEDVRVPLGIQREIHEPALRAALEFGTSWRASPIFVPYRRLAGIRFVATDLGWSRGKGRLVRGEGRQVLLAMFGRGEAAEGLTGDGVEVLAARFSTA